MVTIDLSIIPTDNPLAAAWWFFKTIGWIFPVFFFVYGMILIFQVWIRNEYKKGRSYILLAIDVPKTTEQTPKAVENLFSHLTGAHQPLKFYHKWWKGEVPESFGFEIVSIGGYIRYVVHTEKSYRDLIEAIIYAQYPDAEISEIEDYTEKYKDLKFPDQEYQLHGSEVIQVNKEIYPIITHDQFEDQLSGELKDPLASLLEGMTRIGPGEEIWVQYLLTPADNDWSKGAQKEIDKLIGAKGTSKKNIMDRILFDVPAIIGDLFLPPVEIGNKNDGPINNLLNMTAGEKDTVTAIENKASKPGFHVRIRFIYIAKKDRFVGSKATQGVYGALKQFNTLGGNGLKLDSRYFTGSIVFNKQMRLNWRRNKMLYRYRTRGHYFMPGEFGKVLTAMELASLWHFPSILVRTPLVQKTESKKAEPPGSLPVLGLSEQSPFDVTTKSGTPKNLPTLN